MATKGNGDNPLQMPSETTHKDFIRLPADGHGIGNAEEWRQCGKWKINGFDDGLDQDVIWTELHSLVENGTLLMIKSSTKKMKHSAGIIMCYTRPEKSKIKAAADAIQAITNNPYPMFYKTNGATRRWFRQIETGKKDKDLVHHQYLYTANGYFYEKDNLQRWTLVTKEEDRKKTENESWEEQLAAVMAGPTLGVSSWTKAHMESLDLSRPDISSSKLSFWSVECDICFIHPEDADGLTEAKRLEKESKKLFEKGVFPRITRLMTKNDTSDFRFYIEQPKEEKEILEHAIEIRKHFFYPHPIYFHAFDDESENYILRYMHTAEGEFFESIRKLWLHPVDRKLVPFKIWKMIQID